MIEIHFWCLHDFVHWIAEHLNYSFNHWLFLQSLLVFTSCLWRRASILSIERRKWVVIDDRDEESKSREGKLRILVDELHHYLNIRLTCDCLYHLLSIYNEVVLINCLNENRTEILDNCWAIWPFLLALKSHSLENRFYDINFCVKFLRLRKNVFVDVKIEIKLYCVRNRHIVRMPYQPMKIFRVRVDPIHCLFVLIVE